MRTNELAAQGIRCWERTRVWRTVQVALQLSRERLTLDGLDRFVSAAERAAEAGQWNEAATCSLDFHRGVVHLIGSDRLDRFFLTTVAQLRLAFCEVPIEAEFQSQ
ncbi:hypothetical protein [Streptomyces nigrescens]|uniref:hypothetical protein n=1 Tax=Streptomyces nigrescens TaxID=1920 RepID=UPI0037024690